MLCTHACCSQFLKMSPEARLRGKAKQMAQPTWPSLFKEWPQGLLSKE